MSHIIYQLKEELYQVGYIFKDLHLNDLLSILGIYTAHVF